MGRRPDVLAGVRARLPGLLAGGFDRPADVAAATALVVAPVHADAGLVGAMTLATRLGAPAGTAHGRPL